MSLMAVIDALEAAGVDAAAVIAAVRAHETRRLADDQDRKDRAAAKKRRQRADASPDVPGTIGDNRGQTGTRDARPTYASAQVVNPSLPSLRSEELKIDGDVDCASADDWPKPTSKQTIASILAETVASPWLDPTKSPGLVETAGRVVAWKRDGASWQHDVVPVVTALCVKAGKRVSGWKYFDAAIARSIAENRQALEIPEASRVVPIRGTGPPSFADQQAAVIAEARRRVLES